MDGLMLFTLMFGLVVFTITFAWMVLHRQRVLTLIDAFNASGIDAAVSERRKEGQVS